MNVYTGPVAADCFKEAMSRLAGGVSLVTTRDRNGHPLGMLATSVTSVSAEPPTILVCVNRTASMYQDLKDRGTFCVNFLGLEHHTLASRFSSAVARSTRFEEGQWSILSTGAPVLSDALAALDCSLERRVDIGTHEVIFGRVLATSSAPDRVMLPLVHFNRSYGEWSALSS